MIKKVIYIIATVLLAALLVAMVIGRDHVVSPKHCKEVVVKVHTSDKANFISNEDVQQMLKDYRFKVVGVRADSLNLHDLEKQLSTSSLIEHLDLYMDSWGRMHVEVQPCLPFFAVYHGASEYGVTAAGKVIDLSKGEGFYAKFIPVVGQVSMEYATTELYALMNMVASDRYWSSFFDSFAYDEQEGIIGIPKIGGTVIVFGQKGPWEPKFKRLETFNERVIKKFGWESFERINLDYRNQVVTVPKGVLKEQFNI